MQIMSDQQNIKLYIKKSGDNYQVINNNSSLLRKQANDYYLNKTTVYKKTTNGPLNNKTQQRTVDINKGIDSFVQCFLTFIE